MKLVPLGRMNMCAVMLAVMLLSALVVTGACSKKDLPAGQKAAASKGETKEKGERQKGIVELTPEAARTAGVEVPMARILPFGVTFHASPTGGRRWGAVHDQGVVEAVFERKADPLTDEEWGLTNYLWSGVVPEWPA
jgi:hypothetical protein